MDTPYRFISDEEPTEKQLEGLMIEVICEVKKRAEDTKYKISEIQKKYFAEVEKHQKAKQKV
jgi:hypothetical protein